MHQDQSAKSRNVKYLTDPERKRSLATSFQTLGPHSASADQHAHRVWALLCSTFGYKVTESQEECKKGSSPQHPLANLSKEKLFHVVCVVTGAVNTFLVTPGEDRAVGPS